MKQTKYTNEEIGRIGTEIYRRQIRPQVMPQYKANFSSLTSCLAIMRLTTMIRAPRNGYVPDGLMGCSSGCVSAMRRHILSQGG